MSESVGSVFSVPSSFKPRCRNCWQQVQPGHEHPESEGRVVFHLDCEPVITEFRFVPPTRKTKWSRPFSPAEEEGEPDEVRPH